MPRLALSVAIALSAASGGDLLSGCGASLASSDAPARPILLDREPERLLDLTLPDRSRAEVPERIPVNTPWRAVATVRGVRTWETTLPVRLRTLFFNSPTDDLAVYTRDGRSALRFGRPGGSGASAGSWDFGPSSLRVRRKAAQGPPGPGDYEVRFSRATTREEELNLASSGMSSEDFLFRSLQVDDATRHGLLLPAPSTASFSVEVPAGGVLSLGALIVPPEVADLPATDGAELVITARGSDGVSRELSRTTLDDAELRSLRVDLGAFAGQTIRLGFATEPGVSATGDYVFLAEPTVYAPQEDPPRIVLIFVDTLRQDHMSVYGYDRPTTPNLATFSEGAAVFEQARSVAPWTLPSTRTMVTGVVPERWKEVESLPQRFARAGWATAFMAGNIYLSSNFELDRDWGLHRCVNWPRAEFEIDRALDFLDDHADRPAFVLVHLMDQHLPYKESPMWRYRFAGKRPRALSSDAFLRSEVQKVGGRDAAAVHQHLKDRYDNNLAYVDHELTRLLETLDVTERDTVMLIADHGEEFWDHGGFEHGHSLYDELLHIPAILAGPGVSAGRYAEPVSMLDVAPTLAAAAGLPLDDMEGIPLQRLADRSRTADFVDRPQAFGRLLYGDSAWGAMSDGQKLIITDGKEKVFALSTDPGEKDADTPSPEQADALRAAMGAAMGTRVAVAWRLQPGGRRSSRSLSVELKVPGGIARAWVAEDPTSQSEVKLKIEGDTLRATWKANNPRQLEVFVVPVEDPTTALIGASFSAGDSPEALRPADNPWTAEDPPPPPDGKGGSLLTCFTGSNSISLKYMSTPVPAANQAALSGYDPEVVGELRALGYLHDDESAPEEAQPDEAQPDDPDPDDETSAKKRKKRSPP